MPVILLRDAQLRVITTKAELNENGDYENFTREFGELVPCRAQRQTGGYVKAKWSDREDGENTSYTHKVFVDILPEGLVDGCLVQLIWSDGRSEELRVRGIKPAQLSIQIWLSL